MTVRLIDVSLVPITPKLIGDVAARCNTTEERVHAYLSTDEQDPELLRAFLYFGVGPTNKVFGDV